MISASNSVTANSQEWLKRHVDKIEEAKRIRKEVEKFEAEHPSLPFFSLKDNKDSAIIEIVEGFGKIVDLNNRFHNPTDPKSKPTQKRHQYILELIQGNDKMLNQNNEPYPQGTKMVWNTTDDNDRQFADGLKKGHRIFKITRHGKGTTTSYDIEFQDEENTELAV